MAVLVMSVLMVSMASALTESDVKFVDLEVNDHNIAFALDANNNEEKVSKTKLAVEEGGEIEIVALLEAGALDVKDIQVEADVFGYEYDDYTELEDTTHNFDIQAETTKSEILYAKGIFLQLSINIICLFNLCCSDSLINFFL